VVKGRQQNMINITNGERLTGLDENESIWSVDMGNVVLVKRSVVPW